LLVKSSLSYAGSFPDIQHHSYYYAAVQKLSAVTPPIFDGFPDGTFKPNLPITRAQFAKVIVRAKRLDLVESTATINFIDVPQTHWAYPFIKKASELAILQGYPGNLFRPNKELTRAELAKIIVEANPSWQKITPNRPTFSDVPQTHWAFTEIETAVDRGIIKGHTNGTFQPEVAATRAEAAAVLYRMLYPVSTRIVALDAGHGGSDPGAMGNGIREKDINLDVMLRLRSKLISAGFNVVATRLSDKYVTLRRRAEIANTARANIFVSIHHNAINIPTVSGTEVLYFPGSVKGKRLARLIQEELIKQLGTLDRGTHDRGDLYLLKHTVMPAVIIEGAFVTNEKDATLLKMKEFREKEAIAIYNGIRRYFGE
jgi:N-acetylmuramoyl-L-alanine amidase